jgi:hypothetical protein
MKTVVPTLVLAGVLAGCSAPSPEPAAGAAGGGDWIQLFNGQDLAGWDVYLGPKLDAQGEKHRPTKRHKPAPWFRDR